MEEATLNLLKNIIIVIVALAVIITIAITVQRYILKSEEKLVYLTDVSATATQPDVTCTLSGTNYMLPTKFSNVYISDPQGRSFEVIPIIDIFGYAFQTATPDTIKVEGGGGSSGVQFSIVLNAEQVAAAGDPATLFGGRLTFRLGLFQKSRCVTDRLVSGYSISDLLQACPQEFIPPLLEATSKNVVDCGGVSGGAR